MNSLFIVCTTAAACLLFVNVACYSEPDCSIGCDPKACPKLPECKCGSYLDYCKCCSYCLKCPGDQCELVAMEKCAYGTICKPREEATGIERINGPGWCS